MIRHRIETKPAFSVSGVKTWISGQNNLEFARFWNACNADGTCEILKAASSDCRFSVTHSSIMGVSRVEKDPQYRAFHFYIAAEADYIPGFDSFTVKEGTWAIFEGDGNDPQALIRAEMEAFMNWLPNSEYEHDNRPEIEVYPRGTGIYVEFWLPVRRKRLSACSFNEEHAYGRVNCAVKSVRLRPYHRI